MPFLLHLRKCQAKLGPTFSRQAIQPVRSPWKRKAVTGTGPIWEWKEGNLGIGGLVRASLALPPTMGTERQKAHMCTTATPEPYADDQAPVPAISPPFPRDGPAPVPAMPPPFAPPDELDAVADGVSARADSPITITFIDAQGNVTPTSVTPSADGEDTLLSLAQDHNVAVLGTCCGECSCSTCHMAAVQNAVSMGAIATQEEMDMLEAAGNMTNTSRLGCQVRLDNRQMDGLVVQVMHPAPGPSQGVGTTLLGEEVHAPDQDPAR
ncbi:2fe-2s iron-sulfur cluster binding domain protein [Paraphaeosphaeria sporulosa]